MYGSKVKKGLVSLAVMAALGLGAQAHAQTATPAQGEAQAAALKTCLSKAVTPEDQRLIVRYVFFMMARHPDVSRYAAISQAERTELDRGVGVMMTRLMVDQCGNEIREIYKSGNQTVVENAFGEAFSSVGERGMEDLMAHPDVQTASMGFVTYMDMNKVVKLFLPK